MAARREGRSSRMRKGKREDEDKAGFGGRRKGKSVNPQRPRPRIHSRPRQEEVGSATSEKTKKSRCLYHKKRGRAVRQEEKKKREGSCAGGGKADEVTSWRASSTCPNTEAT